MSKPDERPRRPIRVGIRGARGLAGAEAVRLVQGHPDLVLAWAASAGAAGTQLDEVDPAAPPLVLVHPDEARDIPTDAVLLCLPHGRSAAVAAEEAGRGRRVVDLSGDLRLADPARHADAYGTDRDEALVSRTPYGLTEFARGGVDRAEVVANPGCYPTATVLALGPLARAGVLRGPVIVDAKSGVSGAGRSPSEKTHFCSASQDVRPYAPGRRHRHVPEIEQALAALGGSGEGPQVIFTPHLVPLDRGLLVTAVVDVGDLEYAAARALYAQAYDAEPFVQFLSEDRTARVRGVIGTNRAQVSLHPVDGTRRLVATAALDNLLKGAAGQAIQNLNRMFSLPEHRGLPGALAQVEPQLEAVAR